jgi:lipid A ethanolaminephosphotransferase
MAFAKTPGHGRPPVHAEILMLGPGLYFAAAFNGGFFARVAQTGAFEAVGGWILAACLFLAIAAVHVLLLAFVPGRITLKIVISALLVGAAAVSAAASERGPGPDAVAIGSVAGWVNVPSTWSAPTTLAWVLLLAGLPTVAVWWVRLVPRRWALAAAARVCLVVFACVVFLAGVKLPGHAITRLRQQHPELVQRITPLNLLVTATTAMLGDTSPTEPVTAPVPVHPMAFVSDADSLISCSQHALAHARHPPEVLRRSHG